MLTLAGGLCEDHSLIICYILTYLWGFDLERPSIILIDWWRTFSVSTTILWAMVFTETIHQLLNERIGRFFKCCRIDRKFSRTQIRPIFPNWLIKNKIYIILYLSVKNTYFYNLFKGSYKIVITDDGQSKEHINTLNIIFQINFKVANFLGLSKKKSRHFWPLFYFRSMKEYVKFDPRQVLGNFSIICKKSKGSKIPQLQHLKTSKSEFRLFQFSGNVLEYLNGWKLVKGSNLTFSSL